MRQLILHRLAVSVLLLLLVLTLTFFFVHLVPGEPGEMYLDSRMSKQHQEEMRQVYGLDRPLHERYVRWLTAVISSGDWGISFVHRRPVAQVVASRLPATLLLAAAGLLVQFTVGLLLGVAAARRAGRPVDHLIRLGSMLLYALPMFWIGLMALLLFSHLWPLFPPGHMRSVGASDLSAAGRALDLLRHLALPALVLGLGSAAAVTRHARNSLLNVLEEDYIRTARAKGLSETRVVWVHGLRSAVTPLIQIFGLSLPFLLSGSLIVEVVFSWPGLGRLAFDSALARDYPVILATTALTGVLVLIGNFGSDLLQMTLDPRVKR